MRILDYAENGYIGRNFFISYDFPIEDIPPFSIPNDTRTFNRIVIPDEVVAKSDAQYVSNGLVMDRPTFEPLADKVMIDADGIDALTITKLPKGTTHLELFGPVSDSWTETRQKTDLTINVPGHYKLKITQWPYQDREIEFDAT
jgi:hypothetical protein